MAAIDLSGTNSFPFVDRVTLTNANEAQEWTLPKGPLIVTTQFITNAGRAAPTGTDGAELTDNFFTVAADSPLEVRVSGDLNRTTNWFTDSATAGTVVELMLERPT